MPKPFNQDTRELWTPDGVEKLSPSILGSNLKGKPIVTHTILFRSKAYPGRAERIIINADETFSQAEIEDHMAQAIESTLVRWEEERQMKVGLHAPSPAEKKEVSAALREYVAHREQRKESTNNKLYYEPAKVDSS